MRGPFFIPFFVCVLINVLLCRTKDQFCSGTENVNPLNGQHLHVLGLEVLHVNFLESNANFVFIPTRLLPFLQTISFQYL